MILKMNFSEHKYMEIIDGRKIAKEILEGIKTEVEKLNFQPVFCDILVGDDIVSLQYVHMKKKAAEKLGIRFQEAFFPASITNEELLREIDILNKIPNMCGIIVQLPLPSHLDKKKILDAISPVFDVDCLGETASTNFYNYFDDKSFSIVFPTALACTAILESVFEKVGIEVNRKSVVVLGQGELVGKPVSQLLFYKGYNVVSLNSSTEDKEAILKNADIIISGIGKGKFITGDMVKSEVVIIDAGTSESGSGVVGDVDLESVQDIASYVSPVPGGVGPVTVAMLFKNVLEVAKSLDKTRDDSTKSQNA